MLVREQWWTLKKINEYYDTVINLSQENNKWIVCNQIS
jgi:hypothetical protein